VVFELSQKSPPVKSDLSNSSLLLVQVWIAFVSKLHGEIIYYNANLSKELDF